MIQATQTNSQPTQPAPAPSSQTIQQQTQQEEDEEAVRSHQEGVVPTAPAVTAPPGSLQPSTQLSNPVVPVEETGQQLLMFLCPKLMQ
jgi:hypothetical protein